MTLRPTLLSLFSLLALTMNAAAQAPPPAQAPPSGTTVTVTITPAGVRFVAHGPVSQTRLEVYDSAGSPVSDTGFRPGNVRDFSPHAAGLADGSYSCVLTARGLDGRITLRQGSVSVRGGEAAFELGGASEGGIAPPEATTGPTEAGGGAATLATHDGRDGSVTSTAGALTLRTGDLLAGGDKEHVRVTEEGRVGIGTTQPEATLDVAGTVRAQGGFRFSDGTTLDTAGGRLRLTSAEGEELPAASTTGTGTQNRLAKWLETGGAGTLGDSALTETGGRLGIGTASPNFEITLAGADVGVQLVSPTTGTGASDGFRFGIDSTNRAFLFNQEATDMYFATSATERMRILSTGNVGVGTTTPASTLDVAGNINTSTQYNIGGQRAFISSVSSIAANLFAGVGTGQNNTSEGTNNSFIGFRAGQNNTSGNANTFLGSVAGQNNSTGAFNVFLGRAAGTQNLTGTRNTLIGANAAVGSSNLTDATAIGANSRVDISNAVVLGDLGAKVGIGTQAPTHRLTIGATETPVVGSSLIGVYGAGSAYSIVRDTTNNVEALLGADAGGALYGSMTNHDIQFRINNSARMRIFKDGGARITGGTLEVGTAGFDLSSLVVNGSIFFGNLGDEGEFNLCAGPINVVRRLSRCSSSIRYKTEVRDFTPGLDLVSRLRPVSFRWKKSGNGDLGFVAEEVAEAEPLLATRNERGEVEGVKYDRITAVLVNAVREQQRQIVQLRRAVAALRRQRARALGRRR